MSSPYARPCRSLGSEILPLASVVLLALALAGLFPRETFRAAGRGPSRPAESAGPVPSGCAFVTLTAEQEASALAAARTSWQGENTASHRRIEMLPAELPAVAHAPVVEFAARTPLAIEYAARPSVAVLPPTAAAPAPRRIPSGKAEAPSLAFPRDQMLRLP